jgi:prepilin-type N-terminal cleavage/methylation domain-containing protein
MIKLFKNLQPKTYPNGASSAYNLKPTHGFTLIELLIYMGLLSVFSLILTNIFISIIDNQLRSRNTSNVADDGRYIYSRFIYDVNRASSITQPSGYGSSSAQLGLVINGQNYTYSLSNNNLLITEPGGPNTLNGYGSSISGLLFTKVGTTSAHDTVRINFTIKGTIIRSGVVDQEDFQTTAGLR